MSPAVSTSPRSRRRGGLGAAARLERLGAWALLAALLTLVAINLPELGSDPWPFRPPSVEPRGVLAPLVRAAGEEWDTGIARAAAFLAALLLAGVSAMLLRRPTLSGRAAAALVLAVGVMLMAPSTLLQMGLRQSSAPWFHTNDSTYQIEIGGDLVRHGENPYGHDYRASGLERFYTFDGSVSERVRRREVALSHYAYFPGTILTSTAWGLLPAPLDDYRLFVMLCTLASFFAVMAFRAPLSWRLVIGALVIANPIAVRSAWFGQNDAPSILLLLLSFALFTRERYTFAAATLGGAVLLKQFAIVALPFLALMMVRRGIPPAALRRAALGFAGVVAAGVLPFLIADPVVFYEDTVEFGAGTYRIVGYGLAAILVRLGVIEDREGSYPFALLALLVWLPATAWLLRALWRSREAWLGAACFSISMLVLLFLGRTFNNYYLLWPMMGAAVAVVMAASERAPGTAAGGGTAP